MYIRPFSSSRNKKKAAYLAAFVNAYLIPHGPFKTRPPSRVIEITATRVVQPFHL